MRPALGPPLRGSFVLSPAQSQRCREARGWHLFQTTAAHLPREAVVRIFRGWADGLEKGVYDVKSG